MESAIKVSTGKEVYATEAGRAPKGIVYYRCPSCFERVYFNQGSVIQSPHFCHYQKNDITDWCEKRVDSPNYMISPNRYLIRSPFPIYLTDNNGSFGLTIHFRPIDSKYETIKNESIYLGKGKLEFKIARFISKTCIIPLNFLPNIDTNLIGCKINYTVMKMLSEWGRFIDYFKSDGSFFRKIDKRKLRNNDAIYENNQYYYVCYKKTLPKDIESTRVGTLRIGSSDYQVYIFTVPKNPSIEFQQLCKNAGLTILEQRAEPHLMWPPCVNIEGKYQTIWDYHTIIFSIKTSDSQEIWEEGKTIHSTYTQLNKEKTLMKYYYDKSTVNLNIAQSDVGNYFSLGTFNDCDIINIDTYCFDIINSSTSEPFKSSDISITVNFKGYLKTISKTNKIKINPIKTTTIKIKGPLESLWFYNRQNIAIGYLDDKTLKIKNEQTKLRKITRMEILSRERVSIPHWVNAAIRLIGQTDPELARMISINLITNTISTKVVDYLEKWRA